MSNRPPSFMSRKELAWELDISDETEIDQFVKDKILPTPFIRGGVAVWEWKSVEARLNNLPKLGTVYVIGFDGYVKIGFTGNPIEFRLAGLQTGCPAKLHVYAMIPGTLKDERDLLKRFSEFKTYGEWFRREGSLLSWIEGGCA